MRGLVVFLSLLGISAAFQCNLTGRKFDIEFPDVNAEGVESYELSVEYTEGTQTDYYTEYYDIILGQGRVDSHQAGKSFSYVYRTQSWEAWEITKDTCELKNITEKAKFAHDDMTDWRYDPEGQPLRRTIGPSAMFKKAYDVWISEDKNTTMAYMGVQKGKVRGLDAHWWRRCSDDNIYVDYYFTADKDESPFGLKGLKRLPLRVVMGEKQQYEIMSFQPYVSLNKKPFQLPKGIGCKRGYVEDAPELPSFQGKNLEFHAEVIYRTINRKDGEPTQYWSYYSTLYMALDLQSSHVAYTYSPWSKTKEKEDPEAAAPTYYVYDAKHGYLYKTPLDTAKCEIDRLRSFIPEYKLPNDAGGISLTDPSILFPNNEFTFISEGESRGLRVNVFEEIVENYLLNRNGTYEPIPKAIITHSYLQDDVMERDTVSVKNSLAQVQLRFYGRNDMLETLTFNFFGFTTELRNRRNTFNIKRCFKNEDDYVWATIGFNADPDTIRKVINDVPSIQSNILNAITARSELNPVRIPVIEVDVRDGIFVSLLILGKPPVMLDYKDPVKDKTITKATEVDGVEDLETCATRCLETEDNCWGFSLCGAVCYYGTTDNKDNIGDKTGCNYFERYDLEKFIPSKELLVENLRRQIQQHQGFSLDLKDKDDKIIQIDASSIEVTYPGEDDRIFARLGNTLNPRMRVMMAGYKLNTAGSTTIQNMGKLRYDECQRVCLDFKECETASYCVTDSSCILSTKYEDEIKPGDIAVDNMCNLITRKYADHFERSPGNVLTTTAEEILDLDTAEKCARACLKQTKFKCLSFDHCPADDKQGCSLHTVHYPNAKTREAKTRKSTNCGHYFRKFSTEFKKSLETRTTGSQLISLANLTLEECSKNCIEYGKGSCFGFDFCQGSTMLETTCTILDRDPAGLKTTYSPVCNNYLRTGEQFASRPYSNSYAGGIGFLCFLVGGIVGVLIVFGIAYFRVNRR
ncbi:hypothetical protein JTE90_016693 [Oedothorax gibbosus]|uniref:Apple domain-containing protein n=1 Tax=Oedothorax gibbosus TaxID=931172 RepID=A0AAV6V1M4_9ARAC|nr:hypothetical protein JTE90_016693 [Oedothorax gibbosus]